MLAEANLRLRLADRAPLVVCTNRLSTERGWESLVAAWRVVARHWPTARLWLAGEASDHAAVLRRIASLDLAVQVVPIGIIHGIEVLLAAADVLVTPSPEGSPHALLEAFGAELPTVALDVSVNRWLVVDGREGLLTPPGDPAAISAAILRFLEHPELAAQCGAAARIRADREFSLARMVDEHLALFEECS
jgi:glycosyltransferase involved in cell wall biosynthesis